MDAWVEREMNARLASIEKMASRSRYVVIVAAIVSASLTLVGFNEVFSWHRRLAYDSNAMQGSAMAKAYVDRWVDSLSYSPSLLGVRLHVSDMPLLASFALLFVSFWMFFCARRENHAVGRLLRRFSKTDIRLRRYVLHGITDAMVFTLTSNSDEPFVDPALPPAEGTISTLYRKLSESLAMLPFVGLLLVFLCDVVSLFLEVRSQHAMAFRVIAADGQRLAHLGTMYVVCFGSLMILFRQGRRTARFWNGIGSMLTAQRLELEPTGMEVPIEAHVVRENTTEMDYHDLTSLGVYHVCANCPDGRAIAATSRQNGRGADDADLCVTCERLQRERRCDFLPPGERDE